MTVLHPSRIFRLCAQAWDQATLVSGVDIVIRSGIAVYRATHTTASQNIYGAEDANKINDVWQNSLFIPVGIAIAATGLRGLRTNTLREQSETAKHFVEQTSSELGLGLRPLSQTSPLGKSMFIITPKQPQRLGRPDHLLVSREEAKWTGHLTASGLRTALHAHQACQIGVQVCQNTWSNSLNAIITGCGGVGLAAGLLGVAGLYQPAHRQDDPRYVSKERLKCEKGSRICALLLTGGALVYSGATALFAHTEANLWRYDAWGGAICAASGVLAVVAGCMAGLRACVPYREPEDSFTSSETSVEKSAQSDDSLV